MKREVFTLNLKELKKGKNLAWLSLKTKVSLGKLKKINTGKQSAIKFEDLSKLVEGLNLKSIDELFIRKEIGNRDK